MMGGSNYLPKITAKNFPSRPNASVLQTAKTTAFIEVLKFTDEQIIKFISRS